MIFLAATAAQEVHLSLCMSVRHTSMISLLGMNQEFKDVPCELSREPKVGSKGWVPRFGLKVRSLCWVPSSGPKVGSHGLVQRKGPRVGSQRWVPWLGPKIGSHGGVHWYGVVSQGWVGYQGWVTKLGPKIGPWGCVMWLGHQVRPLGLKVETHNWVAKLDFRVWSHS
jgi:hypothetical protein